MDGNYDVNDDKNLSTPWVSFTTWLNFATLAFQRNCNRIYNETAQSDIDSAGWLRKFQCERTLVVSRVHQTALPSQKNVILRYRSTWWNEQMEKNEQFPEIYYHTDFFPNLIIQFPLFTLITDLSKKDWL